MESLAPKLPWESARESSPHEEVEREAISKITAALLEHQRRHQDRVEGLLEQHFRQMTELLSASGGGSPHRALAGPELPARSRTAAADPEPLTGSGSVNSFASSAAPEQGSLEGHAVAGRGAGARIDAGDVKSLGSSRSERGLLTRVVSWASGRRPSWTDGAGMSMKAMESSNEAERPPSFHRTVSGVSKALVQQTLVDVAGDVSRGQLRSVAAKMAQSQAFEYFFQAVIIANAVFLGLEEDWQARHIGQTPPRTYHGADLAFSILFFAEFALRLLASFPYFFSAWNSDIRWNLFDTALMCATITENVFKYSSGTDTSINTSQGRLLRLLRVVRIARVLRVFRAFKPLRVIVTSILASLKPLLFALLLLFILIYFVAICILQFVTEELARLSMLSGAAESDSFKALTRRYGSLLDALYTLFQSISGGMNWGDACDPLLQFNGWLAIFFSAYVAVCVLCLLNIITGMFVEETSAKTAEDEDNLLIHEIQKRKRFIDLVKTFFDAADTDGTGLMRWPNFEQTVTKVGMQKLLEKLGLDIVSCGARNLFDLFDHDGKGSIDLDEFFLSLTQLRGPARSADLASLRHQHRKMQRDLKVIMQYMTSRADQGDSRRSTRATSPRSTRATSPRSARSPSSPTPASPQIQRCYGEI